jgi:hypothetical protein
VARAATLMSGARAVMPTVASAPTTTMATIDCRTRLSKIARTGEAAIETSDNAKASDNRRPNRCDQWTARYMIAPALQRARSIRDELRMGPCSSRLIVAPPSDRLLGCVAAVK